MTIETIIGKVLENLYRSEYSKIKYILSYLLLTLTGLIIINLLSYPILIIINLFPQITQFILLLDENILIILYTLLNIILFISIIIVYSKNEQNIKIVFNDAISKLEAKDIQALFEEESHTEKDGKEEKVKIDVVSLVTIPILLWSLTLEVTLILALKILALFNNIFNVYLDYLIIPEKSLIILFAASVIVIINYSLIYYMKSGESFSINMRSIFDPIIIKIIMRKIKIENKTLDKIFKILSIECLTTLITHLTLPLTSQFTKTIKIISLGSIPNIFKILDQLAETSNNNKYKVEKIIKPSPNEKTLIKQIFAYKIVHENKTALIFGLGDKDENNIWIIGDPSLIIDFAIKALPIKSQGFFPLDCPHIMGQMLRDFKHLTSKYDKLLYDSNVMKGRRLIKT